MNTCISKFSCDFSTITLPLHAYQNALLKDSLGVYLGIEENIRLLFHQYATPHCQFSVECQNNSPELRQTTISAVIEQILDSKDDHLLVGAVIFSGEGNPVENIKLASLTGVSRFVIDGELVVVSDNKAELGENSQYVVAIIDRFKRENIDEYRLEESLRESLLFSSGFTIGEVDVLTLEDDFYSSKWKYDEKYHCPTCGSTFSDKEDKSISLFFEGRNLSDILSSEFKDIYSFVTNLTDEYSEQLKLQINTLIEAGLGYLPINRTLQKISPGEFLKVTLCRFILAEPAEAKFVFPDLSYFFEAIDLENLKKTINKLQLEGNTVMLLESKPEDLKLSTPKVTTKKKAKVSYNSSEIKFPIGSIVAVTGEVGAGKTILLRDIFCKQLQSLNIRARYWDDIVEAFVKPSKNISIASELGLDESEKTAKALLLKGTFDDGITGRLYALHESGLGEIALDTKCSRLNFSALSRLNLCKIIISYNFDKQKMARIDLLEQPFYSLDKEETMYFWQKFSSFAKQGNTLIVATHNSNIILGSNWVIELGAGGHLNYSGPPKKFL